MKNKLIKIAVFALTLILIFGTVNVFAYESYDTYTYSIDGIPLQGPDAYTPAGKSMTSYDIGLVTPEFGNTPLGESTDLFADDDGNVYIVDKANNRVVVMNKYYEVIHVIDKWVDQYGREQKFNAPEGIYVTNAKPTEEDPYNDSYIYVCDSLNGRIVIFDRHFEYYDTIETPTSPLLREGTFVPSAVAVDKYGRIFVISKATYEGVIVLASDGSFTGFIGAQKVTYSVIDIIWRRFQTKEQREAAIQNLSVTYNNIAVDDDGFVYVTNDKIDPAKQYAAIKSKSADYSPVKKLNSTGVEIMKRNGFFDPGGEVVDSFHQLDVSKIIDISLGDEGSWTILDTSRSRLFTYDQNGNLLFAFGDKGQQLGNGERFVAMTYQRITDDEGNETYYLLVLDNTVSGYKINAYAPTSYCDTIMSALRNQNEHNYSASIDDWQKVLTQNNNFDLAYIGIGKALYSQGKHTEALEMLEKAYETDYASKAFAENRKDIIGQYVIWIVLLVIGVLWAFFWFLGYAKKKNKAAVLKVGRKSYWEELLYAFHLVFHPFDGFWDLKHEQRGSVRAGTTILGITILSFFYNAIGKGYLFNPRGTYSTIFVTILSIFVPVALWVIANWCLTTLFDGEGSLKDIYIATTYSLAPMPLFVIISTILTNVMTVSEGSMVNLLISIGFVWVALLLFFGTLVTHDYSLGKNVVTVLGTIVAMAVIMFVAILFSSLVVKMVQFVISLVTEIGNRI